MIAFMLLAQLAATRDTLRFGPGDIDALAPAAIRIDERAGRLTIELPLITVPAGGMVLSPVFRVRVPFLMSVYAFDATVVDESGRSLPVDRLHHITLNDPQRRTLFAPLALPIFAASKESPRPVLPKYLVGVPLPSGGRYITEAMLVNPGARPLRMQARVVLSFIHPGRFFPLFLAYPWNMDVTFPLGGQGGRHDFDVPPGRSSRSWIGSPAIPGRIVGMGGHAHDFATAIELLDVTTGDTIWHQVPEFGGAGHILKIPVVRFDRWYRVGVHITPTHRYRVTVWYDNPTGVSLPFGGMGDVAGLFVPDRGYNWPVLDPQDPIYRAQINNLLNNMAGVGMGEMMREHH